VGKVPPKYELFRQNPEAEVHILDEQQAYSSPNGEYVAVVTEEAIAGDEYYAGDRTLKLLTQDGNAFWEINNASVYPPEFSKDGKRLFIHRMKMNEDVGQTEWVTVYDISQRKVLLEVKDFPKQVGFVASSNGRYVVIGGGSTYKKLVFFDLKTGKTMEKEGVFPTVIVKDDGSVELYKRENRQDIFVERLLMK
jgi:hypothetical protein